MSEWIRHRGSKSMPKCLEGKQIDVRFRNHAIEGQIDDAPLLDWTHTNSDFDIMAFRIVGDIEQPKTTIELQAEEVGIPEPVRLVDDAKPYADGWIEWKGGECPVPDGTLVDLKYRNGEEEYELSTKDIDWLHDQHPYDAVAYRPHQPQEWPEDRVDVIGQNGNDGLHYDEHSDADEPIGKRVANAMFDEMMKRPPSEHLVDDLHSAASRIKWESVFGLRDIADAARNVGVEIKFESPTESNKYQRTIKGVTVDVYDVMAAFGVTCQARGHAIKKLLMAGQRGHKDEAQDLREAVQAIERSIQLTEGGK